MTLRRSITLSPIWGFFCNTNSTMKLKGHCHTCTVELEYRTLGDVGFPSFKATVDAVQERVRQLLEEQGPFKDATNEDVAEHLWNGFDGWTCPELEQWDGDYQLQRMTLGVLGVHDRIGHAPGVTYYTVQREG